MGAEDAGLTVRPYRRGDADAIVRLFHDTVHAATTADYTAEQRAAWSPAVPDARRWHERMAARRTFVAEDAAGALAGFAEMEADGHLDFMFCRADLIGTGVGARLYARIEREARALRLDRIFTEASITARPFFQRHGFRVTRRRRIVRHGVRLTNYAMEKLLGA